MEKHNCMEILSKVFLALDGELTTEEEKEFLEELRKCSCCLENYSIEKSFKEFLVTKIEQREVTPDLIVSIKEKIKVISMEG